MNYQTVGKYFHGLLENELLNNTNWVRGKTVTRYSITRKREVSYDIYLHQHPYLRELVQRLMRKGVSGLVAMDTEYRTRVKLKKAAAALDSGGKTVQLAAGETLYLPDGATVTLDMIAVRFAGSKILRLSDNSPVPPVPGKSITIPDGATLHRNNGEIVTISTTSNGVSATLPDGAPRPVLYREIFTGDRYTPGDCVKKPYPGKDLDFSPGGAYSVYNWELFYHVPITIAIHLSKNQRFAEAQHWFHYLFNPTDNSDGPHPERFWKVRPFQQTDVKKTEEILINLVTGADEKLRNETIRSIEAWKDAPFHPHVIARYRQQAYMYKTVMAYLDNLIAWGDSLFRQDTGEAIDEALQLYIMAANILGPRPQPVPQKGSLRPQTYANLRQDLHLFGTVIRDMEAELPFDLLPFPTVDEGGGEHLVTLRSLGKALYFCVPCNDKLLGYWDTVADRLFKIRNSLNIQGVFRQLAPFEPPIDPAMLARAAAAGLDVGAVVNGLNQPLPLVRFVFLVQKAAEIAQEVKTLGNNLLSAMEKEDNEALAVLRAKHERVILEMVEQVKYGQLQEAIKSKEALLKSLALAVQRYTYYERQLGKKPDEISQALPELDELDKESLAKMKLNLEEPEIGLREIEVDIAQELGGSGGKIVSSYEAKELDKAQEAQNLKNAAATLDQIAGFLAAIPDFGLHAQPFGPGGSSSLGGSNLSASINFVSSFMKMDADIKSFEAGQLLKIGSYSRREQEWAFQSNLAAGEITQIFKQMRAAQLREALAEQELKNHRRQIEQAREIERFLNAEGTGLTGKITNKAFYAWMKREVKGLYAQCFQFAFDIARKAERALQHELGNPELSYLQFGYLAGKEGLLAGEKLYLDIKRMEMAYHDLHQREYELTKHVSLLQLDPLALIQLRTTGRCTVHLPEELFDLDGPGQYFRRIKTVAVSIPCVTGPYAGVNCKLTLLKSSIRITPELGSSYAREGAEDNRFSDYFGSMKSIVTSSAQNDSGLFELNFRDERYLPFENSGVISEWQLELPADPSQGDPAQFDYNTISDVILHIRYTAREGGNILRNAAVAHLKELFAKAQAIGSTRLFAVRNEFPAEWMRFQSMTPPDGHYHELMLELREEHYPFWSKGRLGKVERLAILARSAATVAPASIIVADQSDGSGKTDTLVKDTSLGGLLVGKLEKIDLPAAPVGVLKLFFETNELSDLWLAVTWGE